MEEFKEELLRKYLDEELTSEEEQEALHLIADDPDMRSLLRFERKIRISSKELSDYSTFEVPEGFSNRVMAAIEAGEAIVTETSIIEKISGWVKSLFEPRVFQLRPAYGMALLLVVISLVGAPYFTNSDPDQDFDATKYNSASIGMISDNSEQVWTRFVYIDKEATSVSVAGDFSDWKPIELSRQKLNGDQVWTGLVPMNRGEHRYMFIKNGEQWVTDPLAPMQQDDGFGNKNAVIYL